MVSLRRVKKVWQQRGQKGKKGGKKKRVQNLDSTKTHRHTDTQEHTDTQTHLPMETTQRGSGIWS